MAVFEDEKHWPDTMSDDKLVESDVPPRYLFVDSMADNASLKLK